MSNQIETAWVNSYNTNINLLSQQMGSRLQDVVRRETQNGEFEYFDRVGATAAVEVTTRHGDSPQVNTPHDRRRVGLRDFDWGDLIDKWDRVRMIGDPTGPYTVNAVAALGRSKDQVLIDAAFGTAYSGKGGATPTVFPTDGSQDVAVDYNPGGAATNSNLTVNKLIEAKSILGRNEAIGQIMNGDGIVVDEPLIAVVSQRQLDSLLRTTEVTSADYNTVKALAQGTVDSFMGFTFRRTELLPKTANIRSTIFYAQSGLLLSSAIEVMTRLTERSDKRFSAYVYACMSVGAVRMEEVKVVRVKCDESV